MPPVIVSVDKETGQVNITLLLNFQLKLNDVNLNAVGQQSEQDHVETDELTFISVEHWQNLTELNMSDRLFNYVLATTWGQLLCFDRKRPDFSMSYEDYVIKSVETLNGTSGNLSEYEFINKFRNLSVVEVTELESNLSEHLEEDIISFLQICAKFIYFYPNPMPNVSNCDIVRSFNDTRSSLFEGHEDEQQKVYLSEFLSNVFTFVSFLHINFPNRSALLPEEKDSIFMIKENVLQYMDYSLFEMKRSFSSFGKLACLDSLREELGSYLAEEKLVKFTA